MPQPTCCTCATLLSSTPLISPKTEKPLPPPRTLPCCARNICATCQTTNPRFLTYCPFCQISTTPSALPAEGLRLPPSYTKTSLRNLRDDTLPPSYDSLTTQRRTQGQSSEPPKDTPDTVHHLSPTDTLASISLSYRVPIPVLRSHNKIHSDNLLSAHKWLLIPSSHYSGPPLSTPPDPEEEERKNKLRRWMVATKCADYEVAGLYLKGSDYDLDVAIESFKSDERWEKEHPLREGDKGKGKRRRVLGGGGSIAGQLA